MGRIVRIVAGSSLVMAGTVMLVLPGPGILTIGAGLAILAKDVEWAGRLKDRVTSRYLPTPKDYADRA
ncbi:MAG: PGPGW domain-containing protein [Acidimicrobiia bacterium]